MTFDFSNRRVVIAGGSRGIGRSIALGFAAAGAKVSICARGEGALRETGEEMGRFGHKVHTQSCDLSDGAAIARYVPAAAEALGGIDILINNASGFGYGGDSDEAWAEVSNIDLLATVRASREALPYLEKSDFASITNISSISGYKPSMRTPAYGAAKAALMHYTGTQAALLGRRRIRANCVAPGSIEFPGGTWEKRKTENPDLYKRTLGSIPFDRLGFPEEIANVVLFLSSPLASWVTGQTIAVDGGQMLGA